MSRRQPGTTPTAHHGLAPMHCLAAAAVSIDDAIECARLYHQAGADIIFPNALTSDDGFRRTRRLYRRTLDKFLRATHSQ